MQEIMETKAQLREELGFCVQVLMTAAAAWLNVRDRVIWSIGVTGYSVVRSGISVVKPGVADYSRSDRTFPAFAQWGNSRCFVPTHNPVQDSN
jgi:hypothetical protein